jgi:hypothetical protein
MRTKRGKEDTVHKDQIQKEMITDLKRENQFLSKEIREAI